MTTKLINSLNVLRPTGTIRTLAPLFGIENKIYLLTVTAHATAKNVSIEPNVKIELEINLIAASKCMPKFDDEQQLVFQITNPKAKSQITKISAKVEKNCELLYDIENTVKKNQNFVINKETGLISIGSNNLIINETLYDDGHGVQRFPIIINAKSGHLNSKIRIEFHFDIRTVLNLSEAPIFYENNNYLFSLPENLMAKSYVGQVLAYCSLVNNQSFYLTSNNNVYYKLISDPSYNQLFTINEKTGEIQTLKLLDFEKIFPPYKNLFKLKILAQCKNKKNLHNNILLKEAIQEFNIEIIDLNDNSPQFNHKIYEFSVENNALINTVIGRTAAFDKDFLTNDLYYILENTTFYQKMSKRRLRDSYFDINLNNGEIYLKNSLIYLTNGVFNLKIKVKDSITLNNTSTNDDKEKNSVTSVKIFVCKTSDLLPVVLSKNPIYLNSTEINKYLKIMSAAVQSAHVLVHDIRYRTFETEEEILRNFTILRLLFINSTTNEILEPLTVYEFIKDLNLPELKSLYQNFAKPSLYQSKKEINYNFFTSYNKINNDALKTKERFALQKAQNSIMSSFLLTAIIFAIILFIIFALLISLICYYHARCIYKKKFLRDAQIAKDAVENRNNLEPTAISASTIRHFATIRFAYCLKKPYIINNSWNQTPENFDNLYYSTQEKKISME